MKRNVPRNVPWTLQRASSRHRPSQRLLLRACWLLASMLPAGAAFAQSEMPEVPRFSRMTPDSALVGWEALRPAPNAPDTRYRLVRDGTRTVLKAEAQASMSGIVHATSIDPREFPLLRWSWKIAAPVAGADMTNKAGDDYAARVYVIFDVPLERLPFGTRAKFRLAEALYGQKIPTAALNYVWDNRQPVGSLRPNAYTDRARMMVLQSGAANAGQWVTETRDVAADFRTAFGEEPPRVIGIALATDTDNTGESATAWYGDLEFLRRPGK